MDRLTYKSSWGDYGSNIDYRDNLNHCYDPYKEIHALRNKLGRYEDLGYTPERLAEIIKSYKSMLLKEKT